MRSRGQCCVIQVVNAKPENQRHALSLLQTEPWLSDREIARRVSLGNKTISRLRQREGIEREIGPGALRASDLALAAGVSLRQLRRWHEYGLLPEPMRFWIGKRSLLLYPPNSIQLVVTVKDLMERYRNVDRVALGLLAFGWPVSESRVRTAYLRFLERQELSLVPLAAIFGAPADADWGDAAVAMLTNLMRTSRSFQWARRAARGLQTIGKSDTPSDNPNTTQASDATWDYLENVTKIMVNGGLDSDEAVSDLLTALPTQSPMPISEQVRVTKAVHSASGLTALKRIAVEAPMDEIACACTEIAHLFIGYIAMFDAAPYLGDQVPEQPPQPLCSMFDLDPSVFARIALMLASIKRNPEIGPGLTRWLGEMYEPTVYIVRLALAQVAGAIPQLEALTFNYLGNRVGRQLLLTPPDD